MYGKIEQISKDLYGNYEIEYEEGGYIKNPENLAIILQEKLKKHSFDFDTKKLFEVKKSEKRFYLDVFQIVREGNIKKQRKIAEAECDISSNSTLYVSEVVPKISAEWRCWRFGEAGETIEWWDECEGERA